MILNSIIIDNIRSYEHEEVEFPRGISLFEGDIGSGKSTVLMAIEFALFGLGSQKAEALLSKKYDSGSVILDFSVDGERYEIKRTLMRKKSAINQDPKNSWIKIANEKELLSPSELKQRVLQILKFNEPADPKAESKIFRYAIFTPQEAMKEVLFDSAKRLETIRKAFGIEDYSIAHSNARELLSEIKTKAAVLQVKFSDISELESQINESKKMISEINEEISKKQNESKNLQSQEEKNNDELRNLRAKNNAKIKLESRKENLEEKIESGKERIENIEKDFESFEIELKNNNEKMEKLIEIKKPNTTKSIAELTSEIKKFQETNNDLIKLESEKDSITSDIARLKESLGDKINSDKESIEKTLDDLVQEKESLEKFAAEIKEKLDQVKDSRVHKETLKNSLEKEISKFAALGNACPTCKQEITESHHHGLVDEKKKEVDALTLELQSITDSFFESNSKSKEIQTKIESYEQEIQQIQRILPGIEEYHRKTALISQIEAKINRLKENFSGFEGNNPVEHLTEIKDSLVIYENATEQIKQIVEAKQKVEKLISNYQREIELTESQITQRESELKEIQLELESFGNLDKEISGKEEELDSLRNEISKISSTIAASQEKSNNETQKIEQNKLKVNESKKWEVRYKKFVQFQEWLEVFFIPTISQIEKQVLLSILQNFNETYSRWYSILVEDPTKESRIDENFTPIVNQDGYDQEVGFLSGGEKTSIALAYRLTLNSLMRKETESMKSNLLILDEPTDGFSKNQLGKVRELLDELKSEQIVLVSHEKELEGYVDNIFQISKSNGISKIVRMN
ncbi:MAG: SMC family ATPase [Nitrosopumilus sp.]|uniref:AAA family ATPase n=1 Tax=Nitrosopumilus sp. TaxID=2024843 RepID=UPI0024321170|nr:SMC family ATPase [Nitrosopumilus sp.]MCV0366337.1 SMC family ATPase [Nitrosopumilus sp.]